MIKVLHLVDSQAGFAELTGLRHLLAKLHPDRFDQRLVSLDARVSRRLRRQSVDSRLMRMPFGRWGWCLTAPALTRCLADVQPSVVHGWGMQAAAAARAVVDERTTVVLAVDSPALSPQEAKLVTAMGDAARMGFVCASQIVHRRLVERGVRPDRCAVVRPGVDFAAINEARRGNIRARLGLAREDRVLVMPPPPSRAGGHFVGVWAGAIVRHVIDRTRMVICGDSPEKQRLSRLAEVLPFRDGLLFAAEEDLVSLIAAADVFLQPAIADVSTTPLAWAMAAGRTIVASAIPAVAEMIAHRNNGLLCKPDLPTALAAQLLAALEDEPLAVTLREAARSQAYEVFGVRRYVDQHARLYSNLVEDRAIADGISDSAAVG